MGTTESQMYVYEAPNKEQEKARYEMYFEYSDLPEKKKREEWKKVKKNS